MKSALTVFVCSTFSDLNGRQDLLYSCCVSLYYTDMNGAADRSNKIATVFLNGKKTGNRDLKQFINALNDEDILTEKGGYLFKFTAQDNVLYLGVVPYFLEGERTYHYDIHLKVENEYTYSGSITAGGVWNMVFKPAEFPVPDLKKQNYTSVLIQFCGWLIDSGYTGSGTLDGMTHQIIEQGSMLPTIPSTVYELYDIGSRID